MTDVRCWWCQSRRVQNTSRPFPTATQHNANTTPTQRQHDINTTPTHVQLGLIALRQRHDRGEGVGGVKQTELARNRHCPRHALDRSVEERGLNGLDLRGERRRGDELVGGPAFEFEPAREGKVGEEVPAWSEKRIGRVRGLKRCVRL